MKSSKRRSSVTWPSTSPDTRRVAPAGARNVASTLSIVVNVFNDTERTRAIAIWASLTGAAGIIGPVGSGYLIGHFWFGSVFLINIPIVLITLAAGWVLVPRSRDPEEASFDP